jgi:hypothetical protein
MGGNNYGLNDSLKYFEFQLDSLDATAAGGEGAASTDWPLFLLGGKTPLSNIAAFKIIEAQIPFTYYVFNSVNTDNTSTNLARWTLTEFGAGAGGPYYPKIAVGNYTGGDALATQLQTAINAVSSGYVVTYNSTLQKLVFVCNKVNVTSFDFTFGTSTNSGNKNSRLYIGFPGGTTTAVFDGGLFMESPNVVLISGPNYIYVNSTAIGQLTNLYLPQGAVNLGGGNSGPQMAKIPVNVSSGNVIFWQDPDPQKWFDVENLPLLNQIDFYLTLGNTTTQIPLKLNGLSFSLKLAVLQNQFTHNDLGGGMAHQDRVVKRMRPF